MIETFSVQTVLTDILGASILYGMLIGGTMFFIGLAINKALSLYKNVIR